MPTAPAHRCTVLAAPWPGVHATDIDSALHYGRHWHGTYGLGVIDAGAHRSGSATGSVEAFAGDIVTTNPGEVHDGRPLGAPSRRWRTVYLEPEVIASLHAEAGGTGLPCFDAPAFADARLRRAVQQLLDRMAAWTAAPAPDAALALACEEALVAACGAMLRDHSTASPPDECGDEALHAVLERLADEGAAPSLAELATLAGLGRFQLLRRFRRSVGTTPHDWLLQLRAERARGLIARGGSLTAAAAGAGFADQSHMTRVFVRRYGFTPGAWQRAVARRPQ